MWWEVWSRPGSSPFQKIVADVPFNASSYHEGLGQVGDGTLSVPSDFPTELLADPSIPSGSLLRLMSSSGRLGEWLLTQTTPTADADDPTVEAQGVGMNSLLAYARLEPYDWDGSADFTSTFPDWVWGGRNVLFNPGFEENQNTPATWELVINASAGTYTLSDGTNTTSAIAFNANAVTIEAEIESDLDFTDVLVSGSGTASDPFVIESVTPPFGIPLTINTGGLTGTATLAQTQEGGLDPSPWQRAQTVSRGISDIFGEGTMEVSTVQTHSGTNSLLLTADPGPQVFGVQQVVRVEPDGIYQAGIWVYPTSAGSRFRFVIRTIYEGLIASGPWVDSLTANTWNFVSIPDVVIPSGVTEVIVRFATLPDGDMDPFYVDDATFEEGLAPMSVGEIIRLIYEDATADHAPRMVWEDQVTSPPLPRPRVHRHPRLPRQRLGPDRPSDQVADADELLAGDGRAESAVRLRVRGQGERRGVGVERLQPGHPRHRPIRHRVADRRHLRNSPTDGGETARRHRRPGGGRGAGHLEGGRRWPARRARQDRGRVIPARR